MRCRMSKGNNIRVWQKFHLAFSEVIHKHAFDALFCKKNQKKKTKQTNLLEFGIPLSENVITI